MRPVAAFARSLSLVAATGLAAATPAAADWLVMHDGSRVETKGAWEVRGATLVFTTPSGTLASVRIKDADLDASREATAKAALPAPAPVAAKAVASRATLTLTDADVAHVDPASVAPAAAAATAQKPKEGAPVPGAPAAPQRLQVSEWRQDLDASTAGVVLVGELRNISREVVGEIKVTAKLLDEAGKVVASTEALVGTNALQPGQHTNLRASFPGVYMFKQATFDTAGFALRSYADGAAAKNP